MQTRHAVENDSNRLESLFVGGIMNKGKKAVAEDVAWLSSDEAELISHWSRNLESAREVGCVRITLDGSLFCGDREVARIENQYGLIKRISHFDNALVKSPKLHAVYNGARRALTRSHYIIHAFVVPKLYLHSQTNIKALLYRVGMDEEYLHRLKTTDVDTILHNWLVYLNSIKELGQYLSGYTKTHNAGVCTGYMVNMKRDAWWVDRLSNITVGLEQMLMETNLDVLSRLHAAAALDERIHRTITAEEEYITAWRAWMEAQVKGIISHDIFPI